MMFDSMLNSAALTLVECSESVLVRHIWSCGRWETEDGPDIKCREMSSLVQEAQEFKFV